MAGRAPDGAQRQWQPWNNVDYYWWFLNFFFCQDPLQYAQSCSETPHSPRQFVNLALSSELSPKFFLRTPEIWGKLPLSSGLLGPGTLAEYESWLGQCFCIDGVKEVP